MCIIIDNDIVSGVLGESIDPDYCDIIDILLRPTSKLRIVYGGKLLDEYNSHYILDTLQVLDEAGKTNPIDRSLLETEISRLETRGACQSNDQHIIALAILSHARILCSNDKELMRDFTDRTLLRPKGKIYKNGNHRHLLFKRCKGCLA